MCSRLVPLVFLVCGASASSSTASADPAFLVSEPLGDLIARAQRVCTLGGPADCDRLARLYELSNVATYAQARCVDGDGKACGTLLKVHAEALRQSDDVDAALARLSQR